MSAIRANPLFDLRQNSPLCSLDFPPSLKLPPDCAPSGGFLQSALSSVTVAPRRLNVSAGHGGTSLPVWSRGARFHQDLLFKLSMYSSHSTGREDFFLMLHSLQQGTRLSLVLRPPRARGMTWSMVRFLNPTFWPQYQQVPVEVFCCHQRLRRSSLALLRSTRMRASSMLSREKKSLIMRPVRRAGVAAPGRQGRVIRPRRLDPRLQPLPWPSPGPARRCRRNGLCGAATVAIAC